MNRFAALLLLAAVPAAAQAPLTRLPPIDQCSAEEGIPALMVALKAIIDAKDVARLSDLLAPDILVDFGGGQGRDAFAEHWALDKPADSGVWEALTEALSYGCAVEGATLVAPSLSLQVGGDENLYARLLAKPGTPLLSEPRADAASLMTLDWHLLEELQDRSTPEFIATRLSDGRVGYVLPEQIRSPFDYSVTLEKKGGRWIITSFIAGD